MLTRPKAVSKNVTVYSLLLTYFVYEAKNKHENVALKHNINCASTVGTMNNTAEVKPDNMISLTFVV